MPSFDVVSEVDTHELTNAIDQANRELSTRFDFKGVDARFERDGDVINQTAPTEFQLKQMNDILRARLAARGIDVLSLEFGDIETNLAQARQKITVKQGIEQKIAKKIAAALKDAKLKVESQINGDKLRVQGKKRDDLQEAIAVLKAASSNYRCSSTTSATDRSGRAVPGDPRVNRAAACTAWCARSPAGAQPG